LFIAHEKPAKQPVGLDTIAAVWLQICSFGNTEFVCFVHHRTLPRFVFLRALNLKSSLLDSLLHLNTVYGKALWNNFPILGNFILLFYYFNIHSISLVLHLFYYKSVL
jgi:hypothetical protein